MLPTQVTQTSLDTITDHGVAHCLAHHEADPRVGICTVSSVRLMHHNNRRPGPTPGSNRNIEVPGRCEPTLRR